MEVRTESKIFTVNKKCDKCGKGLMLRSGNMTLATYPPQYPHECNNCGKVENYNKEYPYYEVVPIEEK